MSGYIGIRKVPTASNGGGIWTINDQAKAKRESIWPSLDAYFSNVSLLLHGNGANDSTTIIDSSANNRTGTVNGNTKISTAQSKFGGSSIYFDGSGDYIDYSGLGTDFLNNDFTIEAFIYLASAAQNQTFFSGFPDVTLAVSLNRGWSQQTALYVGNGTGWTGLDMRTSDTLSIETWHHLAIVRYNNSLTVFHDGVGQGTTATVPSGLNGSVRIGSYSGGGEGLHAYVDELRITKGVARYTGNFTPPIAAFD